MTNKSQQLIEKLKEIKFFPSVMERFMTYFGFNEFMSLDQETFNSLCSGEFGFEITYNDFKSLGEIQLEKQGGVEHDSCPIFRVFYFSYYGVYLGYRGTYSSWEPSFVDDNWIEPIAKKITITKWFDENDKPMDEEV